MELNKHLCKHDIVTYDDKDTIVKEKKTFQRHHAKNSSRRSLRKASCCKISLKLRKLNITKKFQKIYVIQLLALNASNSLYQLIFIENKFTFDFKEKSEILYTFLCKRVFAT